MRERAYRPPEPKPAKVGVYEVEPPIRHLPSGSQFYSYWDGTQWSPATTKWAEAVACHKPARVQCKHWREVPRGA
jgi:hypothetical protein